MTKKYEVDTLLLEGKDRLKYLAGIITEADLTRRSFLKRAAAAVAAAGFPAPGVEAAQEPTSTPDHEILGWVKKELDTMFNLSPDEIGDEYGDVAKVPVDEIPQIINTLTRYLNQAPEKWHEDSVSWFVEDDKVPDDIHVEIALDDNGDLRIHGTWTGDDDSQPSDW